MSSMPKLSSRSQRVRRRVRRGGGRHFFNKFCRLERAGSDMKYQFLTDEQIENFLTRGHVVIPDCFSREAAQEWLDKAWIRMGYDPNDPTTWVQKRIHMPSLEQKDVREVGPTA